MTSPVIGFAKSIVGRYRIAILKADHYIGIAVDITIMNSARNVFRLLPMIHLVLNLTQPVLKLTHPILKLTHLVLKSVYYLIKSAHFLRHASELVDNLLKLYRGNVVHALKLLLHLSGRIDKVYARLSKIGNRVLRHDLRV